MPRPTNLGLPNKLVRPQESIMTTKQSAFGAAIAIACLTVACGDLLTESPLSGDVFDAPVPGLTAAELSAFARGDAEFGRRFAPVSGLGPVFNNVSCASCHSGDGRGRLQNSLHRIGTPDNDMLRGLGGPQIQDKAIPGAEPERIPVNVPVSVRLPPPVFGVGLIEAIPQAAILANADPDDKNGDGISGRPNWVSVNEFVTLFDHTTGLQLGRFGRKAQISNLLEQVVEAYHQDVGITSEFRPTENRNLMSSVPTEAIDQAVDPEITAATVLAVVHYIRALAPPAAGAETPSIAEGERTFGTIGCAQCHTPSFRTGASPIPALSGQTVTLYSDLLLHDMGTALSDGRADGQATGSEWKTPPLWGLRLIRQFLNGEAFLMHDGRARNVEEAILLHGGEAKRARDAFAALTPAQRRALLDFVESR
jgi:CxxC motif-containing protein (DUF1111 family)